MFEKYDIDKSLASPVRRAKLVRFFLLGYFPAGKANREGFP